MTSAHFLLIISVHCGYYGYHYYYYYDDEMKLFIFQTRWIKLALLESRREVFSSSFLDVIKDVIQMNSATPASLRCASAFTCLGSENIFKEGRTTYSQQSNRLPERCLKWGTREDDTTSNLQSVPVLYPEDGWVGLGGEGGQLISGLNCLGT